MSKRNLKTIKIKPVSLIYFIKSKKPKNKQVVSNKKKNNTLDFVPVNYPIEWNNQYSHPNWQRMRLFVLSRDNFKCQKCGDAHSQLHVHHKEYSDGFIWEINTDYLMILCDRCHSKAHKNN